MGIAPPRRVIGALARRRESRRAFENRSASVTERATILRSGQTPQFAVKEESLLSRRALPPYLSVLSVQSVVKFWLGAVSFLQANLFHQRDEARLGANRIPHGIDFQFWQPGSALVNRPLEPVQRF